MAEIQDITMMTAVSGASGYDGRGVSDSCNIRSNSKTKQLWQKQQQQMATNWD